MANEFYISAGLPPNDNDPGDNPNTFHISAGLVPDDEAVPAARPLPQRVLSGVFAGPFNGVF
jgi:hypothetical protein